MQPIQQRLTNISPEQQNPSLWSTHGTVGPGLKRANAEGGKSVGLAVRSSTRPCYSMYCPVLHFPFHLPLIHESAAYMASPGQSYTSEWSSAEVKYFVISQVRNEDCNPPLPPENELLDAILSPDRFGD